MSNKISQEEEIQTTSMFDPYLLSSMTASCIPMSLGLALFTNKKLGAVAGIIGALILLAPCIFLATDIKINESKPNDGAPGVSGLLLMYMYPLYFVVALVIILISMMVMRR